MKEYEFAPHETQLQLIAASNLLCEHVAENLPVGWELRLTMYQGDADLELFDPNGDEVEVGREDDDASHIDEAIWTANFCDNSDKAEKFQLGTKEWMDEFARFPCGSCAGGDLFPLRHLRVSEGGLICVRCFVGDHYDPATRSKWKALPVFEPGVAATNTTTNTTGLSDMDVTYYEERQRKQLEAGS